MVRIIALASRLSIGSGGIAVSPGDVEAPSSGAGPADAAELGCSLPSYRFGVVTERGRHTCHVMLQPVYTRFEALFERLNLRLESHERI
jgi:hypothetical protein